MELRSLRGGAYSSGAGYGPRGRRKKITRVDEPRYRSHVRANQSVVLRDVASLQGWEQRPFKSFFLAPAMRGRNHDRSRLPINLDAGDVVQGHIVIGDEFELLESRKACVPDGPAVGTGQKILKIGAVRPAFQRDAERGSHLKRGRRKGAGERRDIAPAQANGNPGRGWFEDGQLPTA